MAENTYVKMPQADYVAIADAIRAKTGGSAPLTSGAAASAIEGLSNMAASVDGTKLVLTGPAAVSGGTLVI